MTMVGWDVSAGDWKTDDARLVARRVLDDVEPGLDHRAARRARRRA